MEKMKTINLLKKQSINSSINYSVNELSPDSKLYRIERPGHSFTPKTTTDYKRFFNKTTTYFVVFVAVISLLINRIGNWRVRLITSIILSVLTVIAIWLHRRSVENTVVAESILVVKGLGIQLFSETKSRELWNVQFIETSKIHEILIMEGFTSFKVIVYLAFELVQLHNKRKLILPFKHFELPSNLVVEISRGIRTTLGLHDLFVIAVVYIFN